MVQFKTGKLLCKHAVILSPDFGSWRPWELSRNLEFATAASLALHKISGFATELLLFCSDQKHESHHTLAMSGIQWQVTTMQGNRLEPWAAGNPIMRNSLSKAQRQSAIFLRLALLGPVGPAA